MERSISKGERFRIFNKKNFTKNYNRVRVNKFLTYFLISIITFFIVSCKTARVVNTEKVRQMGAGKLYLNVSSNYLQYNTLSIKFDINIKADDIDRSIGGTLRIKKDSVIWISIVPALGIEAARIMFTKDSILFINKLKNEYFVKSYEYFDTKFQTDLSYTDLQSILTNEIFLYSETDEESNEKLNNDNSEKEYFRKTFISTTDSNQYVLKTQRKHKIKKYIKKNKTTDFIVETLKILPDIFKISNVTIIDYGEKRTLEMKYSEFVSVENKTMPTVINIKIENLQKQFLADLKYNKITVNPDVSFPFKISEKYKKIND